MPHAFDNLIGRAGDHVTPIAGELDGRGKQRRSELDGRGKLRHSCHSSLLGCLAALMLRLASAKPASTTLKLSPPHELSLNEKRCCTGTCQLPPAAERRASVPPRWKTSNDAMTCHWTVCLMVGGKRSAPPQKSTLLWMLRCTLHFREGSFAPLTRRCRNTAAARFGQQADARSRLRTCRLRPLAYPQLGLV